MELKPILIVSDSHRPYHNQRAWDLMLKVGTKLKPHYIVSIGDMADFYSVSSHSKNPERRSQLSWEVDGVKEGLNDLDALGAKDKRYVAGNHEDRLTRYLQDKAPELFGVVDIPSLLELKTRGWQYIPYKEDTRIGKAYFTHDTGSSGRNATFQALAIYGHTIITGHAHRLQYIVEGNAVGEYKLSAQFGWLGDVNTIDYMQRAKARTNWALGFGVGYIAPSTGIAYLTPVPIIEVKGKLSCAVNGVYYEN